MSQPPPVEETPEARAKKCRDCARVVAAAGNLDDAIEFYELALAATPDDVTLHQELREVGLRRKAAGGRAMSWLAQRFPAKKEDNAAALAHAAKVLAYDPSHTGHMIALLALADQLGLPATRDWIGNILQKATRP